MLSRLDQDRSAHQRGRIADLGDVAPVSGNFKVVQIGAAKDNPRTGSSGDETHIHHRATVQAHADKADLRLNGLL